MSLSDLASLGSFVSGFAVLVSLVYLALQVRQAERNQRALAQQARATRFSDHLDRIAVSDAFDAYTKVIGGDPKATLRDLDQSSFLFRASIYGFEDSYLQHAQKLLDDAAFKSTIGAMKVVFSFPGARAMWKRQRQWHESGFRSFVDDVLREVQPVRPETDEERLANWQKDIAGELANVRA